MCIWVYVCMYVYVYIYIYIYMSAGWLAGGGRLRVGSFFTKYDVITIKHQYYVQYL